MKPAAASKSDILNLARAIAGQLSVVEPAQEARPDFPINSRCFVPDIKNANHATVKAALKLIVDGLIVMGSAMSSTNFKLIYPAGTRYYPDEPSNDNPTPIGEASISYIVVSSSLETIKLAELLSGINRAQPV